MPKCLLILCLLVWQPNFAQQKTAPVKVDEATSKVWYAGASPGRSGTKYTIKIYINSDRKIEFTDLWIDRENVPFNVEYFSTLPPAIRHKGDSLLITYNHIDGAKEEIPGIETPCPNYKGAACIEYIMDKTRRHVTIKNFKKLEPLKAP